MTTTANAGTEPLRSGVIVSETRTRYRVRLDADAVLPSGRRAAGDVVLVPKTAVTLRCA